MQKIIWTISLALALIAASCKRERVPGGVAIAFQADYEGPGAETKAPGMAETIQTAGYTIGVFGYNTGHYLYGDNNVNPNFMYNEPVSYDAGAWTYSPVKYWPNGEGTVSGNTGERQEYLSFFAYAPYSDPGAASPTDADMCITAFNNQEEPGNPWLIYQLHEDPDHQVDLLFAQGQMNLTKPDVSGKVSLTFHHALACAGEQVEVSCSNTLKSELLSLIDGPVTKAQLYLERISVSYHLTARARLSLYNTGATARWESILNGELTTDRTVEYGPASAQMLYSTDPMEDPAAAWSSYDGTPASNKGIFYIPVDITSDPQTYTITMVYFIRTYTGGTPSDNPAVIRVSEPIRLSSTPTAFAPGRILNVINITLNP